MGHGLNLMKILAKLTSQTFPSFAISLGMCRDTTPAAGGVCVLRSETMQPKCALERMTDY